MEGKVIKYRQALFLMLIEFLHAQLYKSYLHPVLQVLMFECDVWNSHALSDRGTQMNVFLLLMLPMIPEIRCCEHCLRIPRAGWWGEQGFGVWDGEQSRQCVFPGTCPCMGASGGTQSLTTNQMNFALLQGKRKTERLRDATLIVAFSFINVSFWLG